MSEPATVLELPAPAWTPTSREYHADRSQWSSSMLKDFRKSPALAWGKYIAKTIPVKEPSSSMILGSLVHLMATQPEEVERQVEIVSVKSRAAKAFKETAAIYPEKLVVTLPEWEKAEAVTDWLIEPHKKSYAADLAESLLRRGEGFAEYTHTWDPGGVPCKMMADRLTILADGRPVIVELKTTVDPSPSGFAREVIHFDYHVQAALYLRGMKDLLGELPHHFTVAVRNDQPYEVAVYQLGVDFLELGNMQLDEDLGFLSAFLQCDPTVAWNAEWEEPVNEIPHLIPPTWATRKLASSAIYDTF